MVEFALLASVLLFVAIGAIQMALIFNAVLSVSQLSYAGARYASVNAGMTSSNVASYMKTTLASPTINESSGANITVTLCAAGGSTCTSIPAVPSSGTQFGVQVSYNLSANKVFLPATFFGFSLHLPTSFTNQTAVMAE
jgi:hypothetical protein